MVSFSIAMFDYRKVMGIVVDSGSGMVELLAHKISTILGEDVSVKCHSNRFQSLELSVKDQLFMFLFINYEFGESLSIIIVSHPHIS